MSGIPQAQILCGPDYDDDIGMFITVIFLPLKASVTSLADFVEAKHTQIWHRNVLYTEN